MFYAQYYDTFSTWFVKEATKKEITLTMNFEDAVKFDSVEQGYEYFKSRSCLQNVQFKSVKEKI